MMYSLQRPASRAVHLLSRHALARRPSQQRRGAAAAASALAGGSDGPKPQRVAVVGGGFAGLAVSYQLLEAALDAEQPVQLHLFDAYGLGAGGSGAAAGLLHPYTPRGKMLWRGLEAFQEALRLVQAAEAAVDAAAAGAQPSQPELGTAEGSIRRPFAWRHGMLRPARSAKQAADVSRFLPADAAAAVATRAEAVTDAAALEALVPGLDPELLLPAEQLANAAALASASAGGGRRKQQQAQQRQQPAAPPALGLMVHAGVSLHPASYMHALWLACQMAAQRGGAGWAAVLRRQPVVSLAALQAEHGPFDAVVVAAGAAVDTIQELQGALPLDLCHGYSLDMRPASSSSSDNSSDSSGGGGGSYPEGAPSLLGSPYIAAHGSSSLVVGATKRYGLSPDEAYSQLSQPVAHDASEAAAAAAALLPAASQLWPPLAGWQVEVVRSGVRALPVRDSDGSIPYAGRLDGLGFGSSCGSHVSDSEDEAAVPAPDCWVIGGLGARGLVYHAWLGRLVAQALLAGSEEHLPAELLRWKRRLHPQQPKQQVQQQRQD